MFLPTGLSVRRSLHFPWRFSFAAILAGVALLASPGILKAQATGSVAGVVTDPSGHMVSKAGIILTDLGTGAVREITTTGDGTYNIPLVNPGRYTVRISASGFSTRLIENIEVRVNGTTRADAALAVGSASEQVTVTAGAPLVETGNATMGTVVDRQQVVDLPLNGRNFAQLGTLIPGVVAAPSALGGANGNATVGGFGNSTGSFAVNGMRTQSNNFLLDSAPNNDSFNSGFVFRPPPDAIEEFKIMTHSYDAQYGRSAGSVINVVTRGGTNAFHGTVWEFNRISALAAKTYFATAKPTYLQNQFGATAGGRIFRDRLFFFGYYEGFRLKDATSNVLNQQVLSAAMRTGDFSGVTSTVRDPLTNAQFRYAGTANRIDPARISPISAYLLTNYIALPNAANNFYVAAPANIDNRDMYGIRGDLKLGKHSIFGRNLYSHQNLFSPIAPSNFAPTGNRQLITLHDALGSDTWTISDHVVNVVRYARQWINGTPNQTSGIDLATAGYRYTSTNAAARGLPNISVSGTSANFTQGDAQQPFASRGNSVDTISDDMTWIKGRHTLQFGGEVRRDGINLLYINRPNGAFTYNGFFTGNAAADFLLGYPYMFQQASGDPALNGKSWTYSGYAQDQFRINPRLTLVYGGRYEVNRPFTEAKGHLAALHPGQQSTVQPTAPVGLVYPGDTNTPNATYYADTNNISPRLAVIFDPTGRAKTVVRAAWGLYFDTVPGQGDFFQNGTLAPPFQPLQQIDFYPRAATSATPNWFANPYAGVAVGAAGFPPSLTFIGWGLPHSYTTPKVQQYNVSVQQQLNNSAAFELAYVGARGDSLPIFIEVNPTSVLAATTGTSAYRAGARAAFSSLGLARPTFSAAKAWYDSLQANLQLRSYHHIHGSMAYTWSHTLDNVSGLNIGGESRPVLPVTIGNQASIDAAVARERGNALFDTRNRFVLSFGYEFPQLRGHNLVERMVIGGWQANGIFQVQSGNPSTVVNSTTTAQSLTFRPNQSCDPNQGGGHKPGTANTYFNTACFALPLTPGGLIDNSGSGNAGRGNILGPGFNTTDASLFKVFSFHESNRLELRFEAFNVFNEARFSQPNLVLSPGANGQNTSATFGRITSTVGNDSRVIQLAGKIQF